MIEAGQAQPVRATNPEKAISRRNVEKASK
jgi:hypothetical protein